MYKLAIGYSPFRIGVFAVILRQPGKSNDYFHFSTRKQAMTALTRVSKKVGVWGGVDEAFLSLKRLCGDDYFSPSDEQAAFKGIQISSSSNKSSSTKVSSKG